MESFALYNRRMLTIVIQAGGQSSRMGQDKALMPFLGQPLIQRLVKRLLPIADELLITTNQPEKYEFLELPLFADKVPGRGALGGLFTALIVAGQPLVAVVACDMPFASLSLIQLEKNILCSESADAVVPRTAQGFEPLHALYRRASCLPAIDQALQQGQWKVTSWFSQVNVRSLSLAEIEAQDPLQLAFINVNTSEELAQAETLEKTGLI